MRILFLSQRVPYPPNKGDKLRSFNEIKFLSRRHQVSLVCLADNPADLEHAASLRPYCDSVDAVYLPRLGSRLRALRSLFTGDPLSLGYFHSPRLAALVDGKLDTEPFDVVLVFCSSMAQYVMHRPEIARVIDFVDVDSEKWRQYARHARFPMNLVYRTESRRLREYEGRVSRSFRHGFLVSDKETEDFRSMVRGDAPLTPVANGVDSRFFRPADAPEEFDCDALVFTGAMDYLANVEAVLYFVEEILPLIREVVPQARFYVVGSNPAPEISALPRSDPGITVTGYVDRVQPYVVRCAALVAPMRIARGVQNKILEAMSMGVPVVTTSLGFEGIAATPGSDIFVADSPALFAEKTLRLMLDRGLRREVSLRARDTVMREYDWSRNLQRLEHVLGEVTGLFPRGGGEANGL